MASVDAYPPRANRQLRAEMAGLTDALAKLLRAQRERGRTPAADPVQGLAIEDGEAEGLLAALSSEWGDPAATERGARPGGGAGLAVAGRLSEEEARLPLGRAARTFELTAPEYGALLLALAVEIDPKFGRLIAYLNDHVSQSSPTAGLAFSLAAVMVGARPEIDLALPSRPAFRDGLIEMSDDGPLPGRPMTLDPLMAARLTGAAAEDSSAEDCELHYPEPGLLDRLVLADSLREGVDLIVADARRALERPRTMLIAGGEGSGRTALARAVAGELGLRLAVVELSRDVLDDRLRTLRRECRWHDAAPLIRAQPGLSREDWERIWRNVPRGPFPLFVSLDPAALPTVRDSRPNRCVELALDEPDRNQRAELWRRLLPRGHDLAAEEIDRLAGTFSFSPGSVLRAVRKAESELALRPAGQRRLNFAVFARACREVGASRMGSLAQRLPLHFSLDDVVVPEEVRAELRLALAWVRHERKVLDEWGLAERAPYGYGLTAMFCGPPGAGKTMAARALARELELDLYRIDLSRVMSKYIGETERNLSQLFDQARESGAVLFFDEADALFGKRTEVKDAHDRYANVEIGYLLQRMEEHDGVTLLATNRRQDLDEAFTRRFHVVVHFPMPSKESRLLIWRGMFPDRMPTEPDLDLRSLAEGFEISGGEIRNCVLAAGYLAASEGEPVGMRHLKRALRRELRKSGRFADESAIRALS